MNNGTKMTEERIEEIMSEINNWSLEDIRELASQCDTLADAIETDQNE